MATTSKQTDRFPIVDCDGHVTEPPSVFTDYVDPEHREDARRALGYYRSPRFGDVFTVDGLHLNKSPMPSLFHNLLSGAFRLNANTEEEVGARVADFANNRRLRRDATDMTPGGFDPQERMGDMETMGIDAAVVFPTDAGRVGGVTDVYLADAVCRAYNDWVVDYCKPYPSRLFGTAVVPMQSVPFAVDEMHRAASMGLRAICIRPNFVGEFPLVHRAFEPFWAAAEELGMPIALHPFGSGEVPGAHEIVNRWTDPQSGFFPVDALSFPMDSMLTLSYLMIGGVMDRHPGLTFGIMESNGSWITMLLERLGKRFHLMGPSGLVPSIKTDPWDLFRRQCYISFEGGEAALPLMAEMLQDQIFWASDYPHYDAEAPDEALQNLVGGKVPREIQAKILGGNAIRMYGLELD